MQRILKSYLKRLTNLSSNNRSLFLPRLGTDQFIDLMDFDFLNNAPSFAILKALIDGRKPFKLCDIVDVHDAAANKTSVRLRKLLRVDNFLEEERGAKDLYVGWPFIRGKFSDGTIVRAPLLFFPVQLEMDKNSWLLSLRKDTGITFNKTFLLAYAYFNKIKIEDEFIDRHFEDFDRDSQVFRTSLYQMLKESALEIHFNQDNFQDQLLSFENFKKDEYIDSLGDGKLKLYPEAVLGIFPQSASQLVPDYQFLQENLKHEDMESFFFEKSAPVEESHLGSPYYYLSKVQEENTFTPFKMDAFQENAIKAVKMGHSLVVQGPPGTGKSQMICNLISDFIARGKTVLVVSQKRAALDVVYERLKEKNLDSFLGLVHDFKNDRKRLYELISRQIDKIPEYKLKNNTLDAIQLERMFLQVSRKADQLVEDLEEFKEALYNEKEAGVSIKELYLTSEKNGPSISLKQEYRDFKLPELDAFIGKLNTVSSYAAKFHKTEYPLFQRKSFKGYGISDLKELKRIIKEIPKAQAEISDKVKAIVGVGLDLNEGMAIFEKREKIKEMLYLLRDPKAFRYFRFMADYPDKVTDILWMANTERVLLDCYKGEGPEVTLKTEELGKFQETLQRTMEAKRGVIKLLRWKLFSKDKYYIKRVLVANGLKNNRKDFKVMVSKIDNRLNLEHNITKVRSAGWLDDIPESLKKVKFQNWFYTQRQSAKAKLIFNHLRNFKEYFNVKKLGYDDLSEKLEQLFAVVSEIPEKRKEWLTYLNEYQIHLIINDPEYADKILNTLEEDFDALCEFDEIKDSLSEQESVVIEKVLEYFSENETEKDAEYILKNSLKLAWIDHVETKYPILRSVSSMKFRKMESELQNCIREKLQISNDILLLRARERTYENIEYNRLNNMVTYRDLKHQTSKKRRVWPIRKLFSTYHEEILELTPCWLVSPESASAIFPMETLFDLVIFDEASQCFSEKGLPAIYRGKQMLIAGDSKQLKPNDLYQVRYDVEEEMPELEVDSLLELASQHLRTVSLLGHYRSKTLDLINFSNDYFYEGKLKLLPNRMDVNKHVPALEYRHVEGVWQKHCNEIEAQAVCEEVIKLSTETPEKSIGVVTFNAQQQGLIMDILEERFMALKRNFPKTLIVKNIENIQGDEKDIILFSTGYGPDTAGRIVMQFGSLNARHGENRLNVAITRAIEKGIVFTSLWPQQLQVEEAKNTGPKLLKKYLEYVLEVSEKRFKPTIPSRSTFSNQWYLKDKLANWAGEKFPDIEVKEEMPFCDLTVKQKQDYIGAILTDDNLYYQGISVKDAHVYTPFLFSKNEWKYKGVFSREYWNNRPQIEEELVRFINQNG